MTKICENALLSGQISQMHFEDVLPLAATLDKIGYEAIEIWNGNDFEIGFTKLGESPFERLEAIAAKLKDSKKIAIINALTLGGRSPQPLDVINLFIEIVANKGIDIFRFYDPLNDISNFMPAIKAAKAVDKAVEGIILYTKSPAHSLDAFVEFAVRLESAGCDSICIGDIAGILTPKTANELIKKLKAKIAIPVSLHASSACGLAEAVYYQAIESIDMLDCTLAPIASGSSSPRTESIIAMLSQADKNNKYTLLSCENAETELEKIKHPAGIKNSQTYSNVLKHRIPEGFIKALENRLIADGLHDKLDEALTELSKIRADFGWVIPIWPLADAIALQAISNLNTDKRYENVEPVIKDLALGKYGRLSDSINKDIIEEIRDGEKAFKSNVAENLEPKLELLKEHFGDLADSNENLAMLALYPKTAKEFLEGTLKATSDVSVTKKEVKNGVANAYNVTVGGQAFHVEVYSSTVGARITPLASLPKTVSSSGRPSPAGATAAGAYGYAQQTNSPSYTAPATSQEPVAAIAVTPMISTPQAAPIQATSNAAPGENNVTCPMQGSISKVLVAVGDTVKAGQKLVVLEAMKMENDVLSGVDGIVKEIKVQTGQAVQAGETLIVIES